MIRSIDQEIVEMEKKMDERLERIRSQLPSDVLEGSEDNAPYNSRLPMQSWRREWKQESPSNKTYFSESITVIRSNGANVGQVRHGLDVSSLLLLLFGGLSWFWVTRTIRFVRRYNKTVYSSRYKWILIPLWPVLLVTSPKFREEWNRIQRDGSQNLPEEAMSHTHENDL